MATLERSTPRRVGPLLVAGAGAAAFMASLAGDLRVTAFGAVVFLASMVVALRDSRSPVFTWPNALSLLVLVIWLVPIKLYRLPVTLPFSLELYRLLLVLLLVALVAAVLLGVVRLNAAGHLRPLLVLAGVAVASQIVNAQEINPVATDGLSQALKSLSFFLSFLAVFVLVCSAIRGLDDVRTLAMVLVIGGAAVAVFALIEGQTRWNFFDHLNRYVPGLVQDQREVLVTRGGRLRVHASAQHPIALGAALTMVVPLAVYLARAASTRAARVVWVAAGLLLAVASIATVSRTVVLMAITMAIAVLWLRGRSVLRFWPYVLALGIAVHVAAPGAIGGLVNSFVGESRGGGLVGSLQGREGQTGSGRLADIDPGLHLWSESPIIGQGLGSLGSTGEQLVFQGANVDPNQPLLIFDDQYLNTLVTLGILGFLGTIWFVWGAVVKIGRASRRVAGSTSELLAACAAACAAFGAGMLTFDAFAFVQATLIFFILAALGLRGAALLPADAKRSIPLATAEPDARA